MKLIQKLERDNFSLTHERYTDDNGIKRDSLKFSETKDNGFIIHRPLIGKIKVNTGKDNILDSTTNYTSEEYRTIFEEELKKALI